jgi:hypothetical protein
MAKTMDRSILARSLMTGVASLAFMMAGAAGARADMVTVQGDDGANGANAVNSGENGGPGGDGESVAAAAGSVSPVTSPHNQSSVTGGNGGDGGNGFIGPPRLSSALVALAAKAALRTPQHRRPSSLALLKRTPIPWVDTAARAETASCSVSAMAVMAAMAGRQLRLRERQPSWGWHRRTPMLTAEPADPMHRVVRAEVTVELARAETRAPPARR